MRKTEEALIEGAGQRPIIDISGIRPNGMYPLKDTSKLIGQAYQTSCNQIREGIFPLPYKKLHSRLIVIKGSDIIKHLEGGEWIMPQESAYRRVG